MNTGTRYPSNILRFSRDFSAQQQVHPTQKPVPLLEWLIRTYSHEGQTVLDTFMGSVSIGVAAGNTGRYFIGIEQDTRKINDKFVPERTTGIVQAKTKKQELYLKYLRDKNVQVVIVSGLAGTGKTLLASHVAAEQWRAGEIEKIIVSRPYVQTGKTSGLKPGTSLEKMLPYVRNVLENIRRVVGHGAYNTALKDGVSGAIEVQELESIRGRSYDMPSMLIVDEAQQSTPD